MYRPEIYIDNAVTMWSVLSPATSPRAGVTRITTVSSTRLVLHRPLPPQTITELLAAEPVTPSSRLVIEDSFGGPPPPLPEDVTVKRMAVMVRPPAPLPDRTRPEVSVVPVSDPDTLLVAEKAIMDGFPVPGRAPREVLPTLVLDTPGWQTWLAYRSGVPAAAGFTFDDGAAVGIYLLATVPEHRSAGLGRAVMTAAVAAHPDRPAVLVATEAGEPLYKSMGFDTMSTSAWYFRMG